MSTIAIIDDDFASEALADVLRTMGHSVSRISSAKEAVDRIKELASMDLVILDVLMERPGSLPEAPSRGGHRTGYLLAQELRKLSDDLKIVILSATQDLDVAEWCTGRPRTLFISKFDASSITDVTRKLARLLGTQATPHQMRSFIVHGHDEVAKLDLKNYIQNTLRLPEPIILHEQASRGRTILEKFEHYGSDVDVVFVLLTPDDKLAIGSSSNEEKRRARQNVIFELGYFMASLGRDSGRVLLLHKGELELPSDISGLIYIDISHGISAAGEQIRRELGGILDDHQ